MNISGIQPLDLQTEHLDRNQYPSLRFLMVVAMLFSGLIILTWSSQHAGVAGSNQGRSLAAGLEHVASNAAPSAQPGRPGTIDRQLIARAFPHRP